MIFKKINSNRLKYDILYRCACKYIKSKSNSKNIITSNELNKMLGCYFHIPKEMRNYFISELLEIGFFEIIKESNKYYYKILM